MSKERKYMHEKLDDGMEISQMEYQLVVSVKQKEKTLVF